MVKKQVVTKKALNHSEPFLIIGVPLYQSEIYLTPVVICTVFNHGEAHFQIE